MPTNSAASVTSRASPSDSSAKSGSAPPIYVDLDGTLIHSDMLWESFASALRSAPLRLLGALAGLLLGKGRAVFKASVAKLGPVDASTLPYRGELLDWLVQRRQQGARIILATASDRSIAQDVAAQVGIFDEVLASDGQRNLKGMAKLVAIHESAAEGEFDYCGNGSEDLPIFAAARQAIVVAAPSTVAARASASGNADLRFSATRSGRIRMWIRALRPHQWAKNLLVLVPLITSFHFNHPGDIAAALVAMLAMSLAASSGYLVNDLLDMQADRLHPRKRERPFAAGELGVAHGFMAAALLCGAALLIAGAVSPSLAGWVLFYLFATVTYSLFIKRLAVFDVVTLAGLYTLRIAAGGSAIGVEVSFWLFAFSAFVFFSLALVKRCGELVQVRERGEQTASGRGYNEADLATLRPLGIGASCASVLVLALYVQLPEVSERYATPEFLWGALVAMLIWLSRLWIDTGRGLMDDDPLVYALRNVISRWLLAAVGIFFVLAFAIGR